MHCADESISPAVPATTNRNAEDMQLEIGGQETPSESSEADSSECDTTGDEDGWESGESSASLVVNHHHQQQHHQHHPLTHSSSRRHISANPRLSLKETAKGFLSRGDKSRSSNRQSAVDTNMKRSSAFARSAPLDT